MKEFFDNTKHLSLPKRSNNPAMLFNGHKSKIFTRLICSCALTKSNEGERF